MNKVKVENDTMCEKLEKAEKLNKEKSDIVNILEATIGNKNIETDDLKVQIGSLKVIQECQFTCEKCEFQAATNVLLQEHMTCEFCEFKIRTIETIRRHTCKINIY